jgi:predicted benzoate:H+ symporter BenE
MIAAYAIALLADAIQFPFSAATATGIFALPAEMTDLLVDGLAMLATSAILGFHWLLLPTVLIEAVPGLDLLPTWTGCVALVIRERRKEHAVVIDV